MECHLNDNFKDRICRLCLTYCDDLSYELSENRELNNKIDTFTQAKITLNNAFPNSICNTCVQTIEEMFTFCEKVKENQCKLNYLFNLGENNLENFYVTLNYNNKVKFEINKIKEDSSDDDFSSTFKTGNRHNDFFTEDISTPNVELLNNKELNIDMHNNINKKCRSTKKDEEIKENIDNESGKDLKEYAMTFKCLMCFQLFENKADLRKHYIKHMNLYEQDNKEMDGRFIIHNQDINKFLCAICGNMYENRQDIIAHLECHKDGRPFCCKICGSTYRNVYEMIRHGRVHSDQRLHCSYKCGFNTAYRGALKDHEQRHTETDKKYKCEECGKGFQVKSWYEQHQNIHSGEKPYVCKICGVGFHMHRYLTSHTSKLHPQSSEIKRYACMHCSLPCGNKNSLTIHMEKEHGIKATFLCDLCGKAFPNSVQLNYHRNIHLGVKPFSCSTCSKTFGRKFHLKIHEQTHTGEKNHVCSKCSKQFIQKSTLNRHIKRHHP